MSDASTALIRGLEVLRLDGAVIEEIRSRNWASATFTGTRHELIFRLEGDAAPMEADIFLDGLEEREFDLRGHILADIALVGRIQESGAETPLVRISLEALTVEDA